MVNTAGRSRGCTTCRRRRIKCDETHPICKRCSRHGLECSGLKPTRFISQGKALKPREAHTPICDDRTTESSAMVPQSPHLQGSEIQIYICYASKYLLRGGPVHMALQDLQLSDIQTAGESMSEDFMLPRAILSLSAIFFGSQQHISSIRDCGYTLYGTTLLQLNSILSRPDCHTRNDILMSVVCLALMEFFFPTGRKYYHKHMLGLERLMELRGPDMCCLKKPKHICAGIRRLLLFSALSEGRASILAGDEWKKIPWTEKPCDDKNMDFLFNALADVTVLNEEHTEVKKQRHFNLEHFATKRDRLVETARELVEDLWEFKKGWNYSESDYSETSTSTIPMLYYTNLIHVLKILASFAPSEEMENQYTAAAKTAASQIRQRIPTFMSQAEKLDTATLTVAPLAIPSAMSMLEGEDSHVRASMIHLLKSKEIKVSAVGLWAELED